MILFKGEVSTFGLEICIMNINNKALVTLSVLILLAYSANATTRKVLFIGNSYTYTNNMPLMLKSLAANLGDTLIYDESDPGGYTFAMHCTNAITISKIFSQQWDIVVLQEQSQMPSFPPAEVDTEVYPYAHKLDSFIHANDSCTQTMFLMTWGHANGDPANCATYPVICTYSGMQERLRDSYLQMTQDNHAIVAPVGVAWKIMMDSFPSIWLYISDSSHPVIPGSYLESCVLYSSIFHKSSLGSTYTDGLTTPVITTLQQVADRVVFDSLTQWQQYGHYPYAGFTHTAAGNAVTFAGLSPISVTDSWKFGDGAIDTASNPVHNYAGSGNYVVSHTASTNCFSETLTDTIHLGTASTGNLTKGNAFPIVTKQEGNGKVIFIMPVGQVYDMLEVYDGTGKLVKKYSLNATAINVQFIPGIYFYRAYSTDRSIFLNGKLVVY